MHKNQLVLSAESRALANRFLEASIGDMIIYDEMSQIIGADVTKRRYLIRTARNVASREAGAVFGLIKKVGYRRLPSKDSVLVGEHARHHIQSTANSASRTMINSVHFANDITPDEHRQINREISVLKVIAHLSKDKQVERLSVPEKPQPVTKTIRGMLVQLGAIEKV